MVEEIQITTKVHKLRFGEHTEIVWVKKFRLHQRGSKWEKLRDGGKHQIQTEANGSKGREQC